MKAYLVIFLIIIFIILLAMTLFDRFFGVRTKFNDTMWVLFGIAVLAVWIFF